MQERQQPTTNEVRSPLISTEIVDRFKQIQALYDGGKGIEANAVQIAKNVAELTQPGVVLSPIQQQGLDFLLGKELIKISLDNLSSQPEQEKEERPSVLSNKTDKPAKVNRRGFGRSALTFAGGAALGITGAITVPFGLGQLGKAASAARPNANIPKGRIDTSMQNEAGSEVNSSVEIPESPDRKVANFNEVIKPILIDAFKRRAEREKSDPEYAYAVDKDLNRTRVNFSIFTYWEEHGFSYDDFRGTTTVLSYDLMTGKLSSVSFSRDIRTPELERVEKSTTPLPMGLSYRFGGFPLIQQVIERASGFQ